MRAPAGVARHELPVEVGVIEGRGERIGRRRGCQLAPELGEQGCDVVLRRRPSRRAARPVGMAALAALQIGREGVARGVGRDGVVALDAPARRDIAVRGRRELDARVLVAARSRQHLRLWRVRLGLQSVFAVSVAAAADIVIGRASQVGDIPAAVRIVAGDARDRVRPVGRGRGRLRGARDEALRGVALRAGRIVEIDARGDDGVRAGEPFGGVVLAARVGERVARIVAARTAERCRRRAEQIERIGERALAVRVVDLTLQIGERAVTALALHALELRDRDLVEAAVVPVPALRVHIAVADRMALRASGRVAGRRLDAGVGARMGRERPGVVVISVPRDLMAFQTAVPGTRVGRLVARPVCPDRHRRAERRALVAAQRRHRDARDDRLVGRLPEGEVGVGLEEPPRARGPVVFLVAQLGQRPETHGGPDRDRVVGREDRFELHAGGGRGLRAGLLVAATARAGQNDERGDHRELEEISDGQCNPPGRAPRAGPASHTGASRAGHGYLASGGAPSQDAISPRARRLRYYPRRYGRMVPRGYAVRRRRTSGASRLRGDRPHGRRGLERLGRQPAGTLPAGRARHDRTAHGSAAGHAAQRGAHPRQRSRSRGAARGMAGGDPLPLRGAPPAAGRVRCAADRSGRDRVASRGDGVGRALGPGAPSDPLGPEGSDLSRIATRAGCDGSLRYDDHFRHVRTSGGRDRHRTAPGA